MPTRPAVSKKIRFEVFKRDAFTCQYCGRKAPDIVLQLDHVEPVAGGGDNNILNLLTSCADCNAGKSDRKLSDNCVIEKQRIQLEQLQERREQLEMMLQWQKDLADLHDYVIDRLARYWSEQAPGYALAENGLNDLKRLTRRFEIAEIMEAMRIAAENYLKFHDGKPDANSVELAWDKIGGICSNRRRDKEDPSLGRLLYIRGILRNRLHYCNEHVALELLQQAVDSGASVESLQVHAKVVKNWTQWRTEIEAFIADKSA